MVEFRDSHSPKLACDTIQCMYHSHLIEIHIPRTTDDLRIGDESPPFMGIRVGKALVMMGVRSPSLAFCGVSIKITRNVYHQTLFLVINNTLYKTQAAVNLTRLHWIKIIICRVINSSKAAISDLISFLNNCIRSNEALP